MNWNQLASVAQVLAVFVFPILFFLGRVVWKKVKAELAPNHGSSLRDAIDRIEETLVDICKEQKRNRKAIKRVTEDLEAHLTDLGD